jgi:tetratricopeptide (TPR) repeat protein
LTGLLRYPYKTEAALTLPYPPPSPTFPQLRAPLENDMPTKSVTSIATKTTSARRAHKPAVTAAAAGDAAQRKSTLALYESALKLMQAGKFEKAHSAFGQMLGSAPPDFSDRIRMYISACVAQIDKGTTKFETHEERYDYAISLLNDGHYEDARHHLQEIILRDNSADYAFYGLALLASMTGDTNTCLDHLTEAIRLNSHVRFQARLDSDFESVADDPRFTELLYPEA